MPAALLERPHADELRHVTRDLAALELDRHVRRAGRQEALCRHVLGRLAAAFLASNAHHRLGFARLGDYTRERLGISARELQSAAQVSTAFERLPQIRAAFENGVISWTQARLLVGCATPATEAIWLAQARSRTVRALEALIEQTRKEGSIAASADSHGGAVAGSDDPPAASLQAPIVDDDREDIIDGEPEVRFHVRCPRRVRARWRAAVELARRVAGEQLPAWQAAEAIAAEGLASDTASRSVRSSGSSSVDRGPAPPERADPDEPSPTEVELDWSAVVAAIPEEIAALAAGCDDLDAFALDTRLRAVLRAARRIDWQTGRLLRLFLDLRLHSLLGFSSVSRYVRERLGISVRKARALVAIERKTWDAPAFAGAYQDGTLSWVRALILLPVVGELAAEAWVTRATEVTVRRLVGEVEWALDVRDAGPAYGPLAPPPPDVDLRERGRQMRAPDGWTFLDAEVQFRGPASVVALLRSAIAAFTAPCRPEWHGLEQLLDHVAAEWERLPRHRDPIFARDGWQCTVPACSARRSLHDHHVLFRSRGGDNVRSNRVTVCAWHHLRGIHAGRIRAFGKAPEAVHWELGLRADRPPLMRLVGERYLSEEGGRSASGA